MSSYRQILYHIVICSKYREKVFSLDHSKELYKYIWGIVKGNNSVLYQINGMEEHIHILSDLHPSVSLADFVKDIKLASSKWMKQSNLFPKFSYWSEGYGAFTYAYAQKEIVTRYIKNQQVHHAKKCFLDEYKNLLEEHHIEFDEKYLPR